MRANDEVVWTYTYDTANRLIHAEDSSGSIVADYYYDPFGRRLWKDVGGTRTYFFYSDEGLIAEYDENGTEIRSYGYQPDSTWTTDPLFLRQNGAYYWYQNDHLGTPQKLVAVNGAVVWSAHYAAFGAAQVQVETVTNNLRFPGQYEDAETGLHYNFHRYYEPGIGQYVQNDPIGLLGGDVTRYHYALGNPLTWSDPLGLFDLGGTQDLLRYADTVARNPYATGATATAAMTGASMLSSSVSTVVASGAVGVTAAGSGVIAAFLAGAGVGTLLNEYLYEPYLFEPIFDMIWPEGSSQEDSEPHPDPLPSPSRAEPNKRKCVPDDFGRKCSWSEMSKIFLHVKLPGIPHVSLNVAYKIEGWWEDGK